MSVPTLTNMAMAPAMPPPAAFDAAFFKVCESGTFSSAACEPTRRARSSSARKKVARRLCCTRRRAHEDPLPGWAVHRAEARKVHDDHSVAKKCGAVKESSAAVGLMRPAIPLPESQTDNCQTNLIKLHLC